MPWCKYTREVLSEAVASSTTMSGVLRHLGLRQNGGAHAHLRRRIAEFDIDTSHFLGQAHLRGVASRRRLTPDEVLVLRPADRKRAAPQALRRALVAIGRPYHCEACGLGGSWNGKPLNLQIDHIDGQFWDCRPENLRFLCPNCHTQTTTYAGRNRPKYKIAVVRVDEGGRTIDDSSPVTPMTEDELVTVLARVNQGELSAAEAARLAGCHRDRIYKLRRRLALNGSIKRRLQARTPIAVREAVLAFALTTPQAGARKIAAALQHREHDPIAVTHGTVANILTAAGLSTSAARRAAATRGRVQEGNGLDFEAADTGRSNRAEVAELVDASALGADT